MVESLEREVEMKEQENAAWARKADKVRREGRREGGREGRGDSFILSHSLLYEMQHVAAF